MSVQGRPASDAGFIKVDFHIHTTASQCYSESSTSPERIVDAAVAAGLAAIAITDHNSISLVESIRAAAAGKGLIVFPGMELSTKSGHLLALFDPATPVSRLNEFLDSLAVKPENRGNGTVQIDGDIEDVLRRIDEAGGVAIASHIERWPTGFVESQDDRRKKMSIHASPYLSALEITQPQNKSRWNKGQMPGYPKGRACIQGSDAHAPSEIGRRPTFLRLSSLDLNGLRQAFSEHEARIRFPEEMSS